MDLEESSMEQLIHQLVHICEGTSSTGEEESLLRSCLNLASNYLQILEHRGRRVRETKRTIEFELLASDCLAELFQRDNAGRYPRLQSYFLPLFQTQQTTEVIYGALMRLLIGETQHQLSRIFRQRDPEGAKVWRTTLRAVRKSGHLEVLKDVDGYYLIQHGAESVSCSRVGSELIRMALATILLQHLPLEQTLEQLIVMLTRRSGRPICIPLSDIVEVIRVHRQNAENSVAFNLQESMTEWPAYAQLIRQTLRHIRDVIIKKYIDAQKLSLAEALALYSALSAWSQSLFEEPGYCSTKELIEAHWPPGLAMANPDKIFSIFDYLLRVFRQKMKEKVGKDF